jgi:hypothetical protein
MLLVVVQLQLHKLHQTAMFWLHTCLVSIHHEFDPFWIGLPDMLHGGALVLLPKLDLLGS